MKYVYECRILLVDDNLQLQEMICDMLHKEGFSHIDTASCCADTLLYFSGKKKRHRDPRYQPPGWGRVFPDAENTFHF